MVSELAVAPPPVAEVTAPRAPGPPTARTAPPRHQSWSTARATTLILAALVGVGAVLRLWHLGADRLGYDEAFTAMAGRRPLGDLFAYLRVRDSHPPLDYLLHAPLARAGVDELVFRLPSVACSIAALGLFAWWMRKRGVAGVVATGLLALSAFQLSHGREARMYAELELFGVAAAVLADTWLRRPRRWHAPALAALVALTLLTHVSGVLLAAGLLVLPGVRRDRDAGRWRIAVVTGCAIWAVLWGPSFLVQTRGGHSDWIPRTTLQGMVSTYGRLVTYDPQLSVLALAAVVTGTVLVWRSDRTLGQVLVSCALVPALLAAVAGTVAPVLLDRTLTLFAWGALLAIGSCVARIIRELGSRWIAVAVVAALAAVTVPPAIREVGVRSGPDLVLRHLERVVHAGDVVAIRPGARLSEVEWTLGVRDHPGSRTVAVSGLGNAAAIEIGTGPRSGRTWLLYWSRRPLTLPVGPRCAPAWTGAGSRVLCLG